METIVIENVLKLILPIVLWTAIGQSILLIAIYLNIKKLCTTFTGEQSNNNTNNKHNTIKDRIKKC